MSARGTEIDNFHDDGLLDRLARSEGLDLVLRLSTVTLGANLIAGLVTTAMLWQVVPHAELGGWLALVFFAILVRLVMIRSYRRAGPVGVERLEWERPYLLTVVGTALVWGVGLLSILPDDPHYHWLALIVLLALASGSVAVYLPSRAMMVVVDLLLLGPISLWFFSQTDLTARLLGAGLWFYILATLHVSKVFQKRLHQSFMLALMLDTARCQAERLARVDELTGLPNRRAFEEEGALLLRQAQARGLELALIMMDVDHFKMVNDQHGHAAGDRVLKAVAKVMRKTVRSADLCARLGGEEFGILMLVSSPEDALRLAHKLRRRIQETQVSLDGKKKDKSIEVTVSLGVATGSQSLEALLRLADRALYRAKEQGRNRVVFAFRRQSADFGEEKRPRRRQGLS